MKLSVLPEHHDIYPIHQQLDINEILNSIKKHKIIFSDLPKYNFTFGSDYDITGIKNGMISPNTGKSNFWLFLTKKNNRELSYIFDKYLKRFWLIHSNFNSSLYKGTLFEVDIFQINQSMQCSNEKHINTQHTMLSGILDNHNKSHILIMINDVILYCDHQVYQTKIDNRYNQIVKCFEDSNYQYNPIDIIEYSIKPLVGYDYLESMWFDYLMKTNYYSDVSGILIYNLDSNLVIIIKIDKQINKSIKKVKYHETITDINKLNMLVVKTENIDNYELLVYDDKKQLKYVGIALVNDIMTSKMLSRQFNQMDKFVFECTYDKYFQKWKPCFVVINKEPDIVIDK